MRKGALFLVVAAIGLLCFFGGCSDKSKDEGATGPRIIMASDTILSGMIASLLPSHRYRVEAILPPGQCPGHYDVKLTDIAKMKQAVLVVSFRDMPFMGKAVADGGAQLLLDTGGRNWMAPDSYVYGVGILADELTKVFPEDKAAIMTGKERTVREVKAEAERLTERIRQRGLIGRSGIASFMQKETLEWMGIRVVGEYGRQEAMSTREVVRLCEIGKNHHAVMVVDNLQSGPDTGKGIAETLKVPHVVLTNFPSEKGYLPTLEENVDAVLKSVAKMTLNPLPRDRP